MVLLHIDGKTGEVSFSEDSEHVFESAVRTQTRAARLASVKPSCIVGIHHIAPIGIAIAACVVGAPCGAAPAHAVTSKLTRTGDT